MKRRHLSTEQSISVDHSASSQPSPDMEIDKMVVTETHRSLACQTDMTVSDLSIMEAENEQRNEELKVTHEQNKGYPNKEQLQNDPKLLRFYMGFGNFTVFMAIFEFVAKDLVHSKHNKITAFDCYLSTLK